MVLTTTRGDPDRPPLPEADAQAALPTGEAKRALVRDMFDTIAPRYDLVNRLMTFGLDVGWRRRTLASLRLVPGSRVGDVGCGTGDLARELAAAGHVAVGLDLSFGMLRCARGGRATLLNADAARLPLRTGSLDGVVSGFALRNFSDLDAALSELGRVLRPGGRLALLEVAEPVNPALRLGHHLWFTQGVPRLGGALSDRAAYAYLPKSVAYLPDYARLAAMLLDRGFEDVGRERFAGGVAQCVSATLATDAADRGAAR